MQPDLYHAHHSRYQDDLSFWLAVTAGCRSVLDLGCGSGRVTLPLARSGRQVWGVDKDRGMLELARRLLAEEPSEIQTRVTLAASDMVIFKPDRHFEAAVSACNTLSTLGGSDRRKLFDRLTGWIEPGGWFVFSVPNPAVLLELSREEEFVEEERFHHPASGYPVIVSSRIIKVRDKVGWDWIYDTLHPDGTVNRTTISSLHTTASRDTYRGELFQAGWRVSAEYGEFDRSEWTESSPYLILAAVNDLS